MISIHHSETICNSLKENKWYEMLSDDEKIYIPSINTSSNVQYGLS